MTQINPAGASPERVAFASQLRDAASRANGAALFTDKYDYLRPIGESDHRFINGRLTKVLDAIGAARSAQAAQADPDVTKALYAAASDVLDARAILRAPAVLDPLSGSGTVLPDSSAVHEASKSFASAAARLGIAADLLDLPALSNAEAAVRLLA